ncbi:DNA polymerase III subunit gamma/tau, partial [Mycobacterium eburneum]
APPAAPAVPGEPDAAAVRTMWPTVRDKVRQRSRTTEVMLAGATVQAVDGNTLVLVHESAPLARRLCEQRNTDVIADALKDALGVNWRVRCESGTPAAAPAAAAPSGGTDPARRAAEAQRAEEERMLAEASAGRDEPAAERRDPEEAALELLQNELGARRIDNGSD